MHLKFSWFLIQEQRGIAILNMKEYLKVKIVKESAYHESKIPSLFYSYLLVYSAASRLLG
ncbi:hypothetical protein DHCNIT_0009720 [Dehalococcoides mccartyi]|nr:hypothetical protein DHCNIT_0009720 [Dehalococcoides mccartyi]BEL01162.1 hypothetical protein DMOBY_10150 [Dehalococcoides mccartyi]